MRVLLSLGSNRGDRMAYLRAAVEQLERHAGMRVEALSGIFETEPVGVTGQDAYLNMAAVLETALSPRALLGALKAIEQATGRTPGERWGPREIDLDIILCEDRVISEDGLCVPHASFRKRRFVLAPLMELAPEAIDPVSGRTVADLANDATVEGTVERITIAL
jgi:2-amino-4-hydroxy-6-hydroxymethyldihydropteridine diphosphokinase